MIGKSIIQNGLNDINLVPTVDFDQIQKLQEEIEKCNGEVDIKPVIEESGLSDLLDVDGFLENVTDAFKNKTQIEQGEINTSIIAHNRQLIAEQAHGFRGVSRAISEYNSLQGQSERNQQRFARTVSTSNSNLGNYFNNVQAGQATMRGYAVSLVGATVKTIALEAASIALNAALTMGVSLAIQGLVTLITNWVNSQEVAAEKLENAKQTAEQYKNSIMNLSRETKENASTAKELGEEYAKLAHGVDQFTNKNISLSTDEYERFLNVNNQLSDLFPQLTQGYDDNGNAILNLGDNVDTITKKIETLIEQQERLANIELKKNLKSYIEGDEDNPEGAAYNLEKLKEKYEEAKDKIKEYGEVKKVLDKEDPKTKDYRHFKLDQFQMLSDITEIAGFTDYYSMEDALTKENKSKKDKFNLSKIKKASEKYLKELKEEEADVKREFEAFNKEINQMIITAFLPNEEIYKNNKKYQGLISDLVSNIDWTKIKGFDPDKWETKDYENYIKEHVLKPIQMGVEGNKIGIEFLSVFEIDREKYDSYQDYVKAVKEKIDKLKKRKDKDGKRIFSDAQIDSYEKQMGVSDENDSGEVSGQKLINKVKKRFPEITDYVLTLSEDGLRKLYSMTDSQVSKLKDMIKAYGKDAITSLSEEDFKIAVGLDIKMTDKEVQDELDRYEKGGNVDLNHRPTIKSDELIKAGWQSVDSSLESGNTVTSYGNTYTNKKGTVALNFTPILVDNKGNYKRTLSPQELQKYAEEVIAGVHDDYLKLQIGAKFEGKDAEKQAKETFERISEIQSNEDTFKSWEEFLAAIEKAKMSLISDLNQNSWDSFTGISDEEKNKLIELAKQGKLTIETFKDNPNKKNILDHFGMSAEAAVEAINKLVTRADQLNSMGGSIRSLSNNLATKKENKNKGITSDVLAGMSDELKSNTDEWAEYERVMMDANSTYEDCEKVTNKLATAFVNNENYLANLTDETKEAYISDLKAMGVKNAEEVVTEALTMKIAKLDAEKEVAKLTSAEFAAILGGEIDGLAKEKGWSEEVTIAVRRMVLEKQIFNQNALDTSSSIDALIALAEQCGATNRALADLNYLKTLQLKLETGKFSSPLEKAEVEKAAANMQKQIEGMTQDGTLYKTGKNQKKIDVNISSINSSNDTSKNTSKDNAKDKAKETKTAIDWIARSLKVLQDKIDITKAKFENLFSFNEKKNNLLQQIKETTTLLNQQKRALNAYSKEAKKALKKVGSGTITVTTNKSSKKNKSSKNDLASIAAKEVGYKEYTKNGHDNGNKYGASFGRNFEYWCQFFVSWVYKKAGLGKGKVIPGNGLTSTGWNYFQNKKDKNGKKTYWGTKGKYTPQRNDTIYFYSKVSTGHVGLVEKVKNGKVYTIEGNKDNQVKRKNYSLNSSKIRGYAKTSKYFSGSSKSSSSNKKAKVTTEQLNYIEQLVTNKNVTKKALLKSMVIKKYGQKKAEKINAYIDQYDNVTDLKKAIQETKKNLRELYSQLYQLYIDRAEAKKETLDAEIESTSNSVKKNSFLRKEIKQIETSYKYQIKQAKLNKDWIKIATLKAQKYNEILQTQKQILQNTQEQAEAENSILEAKNNNSNRKTKISNYNKEASNLLNANQQIEKDRKTALKSTVVTERAREITNAEFSTNGRSLLSSINSKLKNARLSKTVLADIQNRLRNGQAIPEKYIKKLKKLGKTSLANKLTKYNKERKELLKENKKEYKKQINDDAILLKEENISSARELKSNAIQELIDQADEMISRLGAEYENLSTSKTKIDNLNLQLDQEKIAHEKRILQLKNDILDKDELANKLAEENANWIKTQTDNYKKQFDTINEELDNRNGLINNGINILQSVIDTAEAYGEAINTDFYKTMIKYTQGENSNLEKAIKDQLDYINGTNGKEKATGQNFYDMMDVLSQNYSQLEENTKQVREYQKAINEIELKPFEKLADKLEFLNDEFEFMLKVIQDGNELFDEDSGSITDAGLSTFAVYFDQMDIAEKAIENYKDELKKVEKQYELGTMSLEDYTEKTQELTKEIWSQSEAYIGLKDAIIQMVKDGLDAQLNALDKMIEKYKKALSNEKDLYEYQKNIAKQTKNIANIQKQIAALSGDSSDEARSKIQKLKVQLEEAQDELKDTEYNKWYEDQTNMLDDMRDEIADAFDDIIKNHRDEILNNLIPAIRASSSNELIQRYMAEFGYNPTSDMNSLISGQDVVKSTVDNIKTRIDDFYAKVPSLEETLAGFSPLFDKVISASSQYGSVDNGNETNNVNTDLVSTNKTNTEIKDDSWKDSNTNTQTVKSMLFDIISYINQNTKTTSSNTPIDTASGHQLNNYLNKNFGLALTEKDEQMVYNMLKEELGMIGNYSGEEIMQRTMNAGLLSDLPNVLSAKLSSLKTDQNTNSAVEFGNGIITGGISSEISKTTKENVRKYLNKLTFPQNEEDVKARTEFAKKYKSANRIKSQWNGHMVKSMSQLVHIAKLFGMLPSNVNEKTYTLSKEEDNILYKLLKTNGFHSGGIGRLVKKAGEDGLAWVRNGEGFVMPEHVPPIKQLVEITPKVNKIMDDVQRNIPNGNMSQIIDIGGIDMHFDGSNIVDPQSFMEALDNTQVRNKVAKMVGNQFSKNYMNTLSKF